MLRELPDKGDAGRLSLIEGGQPSDRNELELAGVVHCRWPSIALLITSGVVRMPATLPGGGVFIEKPYTTLAPVRIIRELIQQAGPRQHH